MFLMTEGIFRSISLFSKILAECLVPGIPVEPLVNQPQRAPLDEPLQASVPTLPKLEWSDIEFYCFFDARS